MTKKYEIEYLGKILKTNYYSNISDEKCDEIRKLYYEKVDFDLVKKNLINIFKGKNNVSYIIDYYLKSLMDKVKLNSAKWSIQDVMNCNDLIRYYYSRIISNEKVYPKTFPLIRHFKTSLRISGGGVAMKASNFPIKTIDDILKEFNVNDNYYDFSCGWGVRMLSSIRNKINYFGTDPNYLLIDKLKEIHNEYNKVNKTNTFIDIRCQGSEILIKEWINKMGIIFSSPPYFNLEDYKIGEQSIKKFDTYDDWFNKYLLTTIINCKKYLIKEGYILINIKNILKYNLYDDTKIMIESLGLKYRGYRILKNIKRPSRKLDLNTDEKIMVFQK
jgi:hypothetical protein